MINLFEYVTILALRGGIVLLTLLAQTAHGQEVKITGQEARAAKEEGHEINTNVVKLGMSAGLNFLMHRTYDPALSPIDNTLQLQRISPASFVISTSLIVNPRTYYENGGEYYSVPKWLSFVATVNLAEIGSSQTAYNKKIDGGLGIGLRLGDDFHLALTAEVISLRQLRDYITDLEGETIEIDGQSLTSLDASDNRLFVDKYTFGLSLKFIYVFLGKDDSADDQEARKARKAAKKGK